MTMTALRSYVGDTWVTPDDEGAPVHDAVTGEEVARVSTKGIDMRAALEHGRAVGGPALRELTFHQRAALLKDVGLMLREHREELYAISARTGATLFDSRFDIDGGIGVLLGYASKAKRELPNETVVVEGAPEPLGRGGQFLGQHILSPLRGVAVQINAFNFPVWGPAGEVRPGVHRRRPDAGQTRLADRLPHLAGHRTGRRVRTAARRCAAVRVRQRRRSARPPRGAGPRRLHRLCLDRAAVALAPDRRVAGGAVQRRGRLAELLDPRPGRRARHAGVRPVRQAGRAGDDGQGRPEVHRDPPGVRAGRDGRRRGRRGVGPAGQGDGRQPVRRGGADGRAGQPRAARRGPPLAEGAAVGRHDRVRRPGARRRSSTPTPNAGRSCPRSCCGPRTRPPTRCTRSRRSGRCRP